MLSYYIFLMSHIQLMFTRWMHTHRIAVLLQHDQPLPKHLLQCSSTGRSDYIIHISVFVPLYFILGTLMFFDLLK